MIPDTTIALQGLATLSLEETTATTVQDESIRGLTKFLLSIGPKSLSGERGESAAEATIQFALQQQQKEHNELDSDAGNAGTYQACCKLAKAIFMACPRAVLAKILELAGDSSSVDALGPAARKFLEDHLLAPFNPSDFQLEEPENGSYNSAGPENGSIKEESMKMEEDSLKSQVQTRTLMVQALTTKAAATGEVRANGDIKKEQCEKEESTNATWASHAIHALLEKTRDNLSSNLVSLLETATKDLAPRRHRPRSPIRSVTGDIKPVERPSGSSRRRRSPSPLPRTTSSSRVKHTGAQPQSLPYSTKRGRISSYTDDHPIQPRGSKFGANVSAPMEEDTKLFSGTKRTSRWNTRPSSSPQLEEGELDDGEIPQRGGRSPPRSPRSHIKLQSTETAALGAPLTGRADTAAGAADSARDSGAGAHATRASSPTGNDRNIIRDRDTSISFPIFPRPGGSITVAAPCLHFSGLPSGLGEPALRTECSLFGRVASIHFPPPSSTSSASSAPGKVIHSVAFVTFKSMKDAAKCYESMADQSPFQGTAESLRLRFCPAEPKESSEVDLPAATHVWVADVVTSSEESSLLRCLRESGGSASEPHHVSIVKGRRPGALLSFATQAAAESAEGVLRKSWPPPRPPPSRRRSSPPPAPSAPLARPGRGMPPLEYACKSLWVGQVPLGNSAERDLVDAFAQFGDLIGHRIIARSSCGFFNYFNLNDAIEARRRLDGARVAGSTLVVEFKHEKQYWAQQAARDRDRDRDRGDRDRGDRGTGIGTAPGRRSDTDYPREVPPYGGGPGGPYPGSNDLSPPRERDRDRVPRRSSRSRSRSPFPLLPGPPRRRSFGGNGPPDAMPLPFPHARRDRDADGRSYSGALEQLPLGGPHTHPGLLSSERGPRDMGGRDRDRDRERDARDREQWDRDRDLRDRGGEIKDSIRERDSRDATNHRPWGAAEHAQHAIPAPRAAAPPPASSAPTILWQGYLAKQRQIQAEVACLQAARQRSPTGGWTAAEPAGWPSSLDAQNRVPTTYVCNTLLPSLSPRDRAIFRIVPAPGKLEEGPRLTTFSSYLQGKQRTGVVSLGPGPQPGAPSARLLYLIPANEEVCRALGEQWVPLQQNNNAGDGGSGGGGGSEYMFAVVVPKGDE